MPPESDSPILKGVEPRTTVFMLSGEEVEAPAEKDRKFVEDAFLFKGNLENAKALWNTADKVGFQRGLKEGYKEGYESGKEEGIELGIKKGTTAANAVLNEAINLLSLVAKQYSEAQEKMFLQVKPELIKFCLAACETLLRRKLLEPEHFFKQVEIIIESGKSLLEKKPVNIVLSPEDLAMLKNYLKTNKGRSSIFQQVNFVENEDIPRGDCRVETPIGLLNFDIRRLLDEIGARAMEGSSPENTI